MSDISIKVNDKYFRDWNNLLVTKELESVAGSFEFNLVSTGSDWLPLLEGDQIEIFHKRTPLITGFVDYIGPDLDAEDRTIIVSGRDNTCDLVDCTYDGNKTEFKGVHRIDAIARELISQFNMDLVSQLDATPALKNFKYDPGEKIWDALERAASQTGVLFQPSGDGRLLLTMLPDVTESVWLVEGEKLLSCYANYDNSSRFSHYSMIAELPSTEKETSYDPESDPDASAGDDELDIADRREVKNPQTIIKFARDENVRRYRPLTLIADSKMTPNACQDAINWEMSVRAARAFEASAIVQGWDYNGKPWLPNTIIKVHSPKNEIYELDLLITSVTYTFDEDGTTTSLSLAKANAYQPKPRIFKDERLKEKAQTAP